MKVLYFSPRQIWPVNSGARLRDYHLAQQLAANSAVTFVEMCPVGEVAHPAPEDSLLTRVITLDRERAYSPSRILRGLIGPVPVTILNYWSSWSASQLANVLRFQQFDTVQIEGVHLMQYLPVVLQAPGSPSIVVDWHNIESEIVWRYARTAESWAKRIAARRTAKLIERAEDRLLGMYCTHTVTSMRERQKLLARRPGANIHVIPNGVDTSFFSAGKIGESECQAGQANSRQNIVFVGYMDYHANVEAVTWFSQAVWPEIARQYPDLHFTIVGRDPSPEVRALASDRIHVTGTVEDVRPFYASAVAAVVPLRSGGGTRLKILEAMAAGVPVVSTRLGAEGINVEHETEILLADNCQEIASAISRIVSSTETRNRLASAARAMVAQEYDWSSVGKHLYRIHCDLVQAREHGLSGTQPLVDDGIAAVTS